MQLIAILFRIGVCLYKIFNDNRDNRDNFCVQCICFKAKPVVSIVSIVVFIICLAMQISYKQ